MSDLQQGLLAFALLTLLVVLPVRRMSARRGSGYLAQRAFKQAHGAQVARLLGRDVPADTNRRSPWMNVELDGRAARLVIARLTPEHLQAGVDLSSWEIPVEIWLTDGSPDELDIPDGIDPGEVLRIVRKLHAAGVDSVASAQAGPFVRHILRVRFATLDELPAQLDRITPLLRALEQLAPGPSPATT